MKRGLLCILFVVLLTVNVSAIVVSESTPVVLINLSRGLKQLLRNRIWQMKVLAQSMPNIPNKRVGLVWVFFRLGEFVR